MTHRLASLVFLSSLACGTSALANLPTDEHRPLFDEARSYYQQEAYKEAVIQLKNQLKTEPDHAPSRLLLARSYLAIGAAAAAETEFTRAERLGIAPEEFIIDLGKTLYQMSRYQDLLEKLNPNQFPESLHPDLYEWRIRALLEQRILNKAEIELAQLFFLQPDNVFATISKAKIEMGKNRHKQAEATLDELLKKRPDTAEAWFIKAEINRAENKLQKSLSLYDKAVKLDQDMLPAYLSRAAILVELDEMEKALSDLQQIRRLSENHPGADYLQALILSKQGDNEGAARLLGEATITLQSRDPSSIMSDTSALLLAGVINYSQKRFDAAYDYLKRYAALFPYHAESRRMLATIMIRRGENGEAIEVLQRVMELLPDDPQTYALLATAYLRSGEAAKAEPLFEKALQLAPDKAALRGQLALSQISLGKQNSAAGSLERTLTEAPGNTSTRMLLIMQHLRDEKLDEALEQAQILREQQNNSAFSLNLLGGIQMRRGQLEEAEQLFDQALEKIPNYLPTKLHLVELDIQRDKLNSARNRLILLLDADPSDTRILRELSRLEELAKDESAAMDWLERLYALEPGNTQSAARLIDFYLKNGAQQKADKIINGLLARNPDNPRILILSGRVQLANRKYSEAATTFQTLSNLLDSSAPGLYQAAALQLQARDDAGARMSLEKATVIDSSYEPAYLALTRLYLQMNDAKAAQVMAERLAYTQPKRPLGHRLLADMHMVRKEYRQAANAYKTAAELGANSDIILGQHKAHMLLGQREQAVTVLESWIEKHPEDGKVKQQLASAYYKSAQPKKAAQLYETLLAERPNNLAILNNLALIYLQDAPQKALPLARKAAKIAPENPAIMDTLGWSQAKTGDLAAALKTLKNAYRLAGSRAEIRYHIGAVLYEMGQTKAAKPHLQAALSNEQNYSGREHAAQLLNSISQ